MLACCPLITIEVRNGSSDGDRNCHVVDCDSDSMSMVKRHHFGNRLIRVYGVTVSEQSDCDISPPDGDASLLGRKEERTSANQSREVERS